MPLILAVEEAYNAAKDDPAFHAEVEALGGYDCARGGDVRIVHPDAVAAS